MYGARMYYSSLRKMDKDLVGKYGRSSLIYIALVSN